MDTSNLFAFIFQFKFELNETEPRVWRRIQVPGTYSFWDLHCAIQNAMGWRDQHLHVFEVPSRRRDRPPRRFGIYDPDEDCDELAGWEHHIAKHVSMSHPAWSYLYDFGDGWEHTVTLEAVLQRDLEATYPRCLQGERACPPEDCGGVDAYAEIVAGRVDPETKTWITSFYPGYKADRFDPRRVKFEDPSWRLAYAFGHE